MGEQHQEGTWGERQGLMLREQQGEARTCKSAYRPGTHWSLYITIEKAELKPRKVHILLPLGPLKQGQQLSWRQA